jgi:hypothetical protein
VSGHKIRIERFNQTQRNQRAQIIQSLFEAKSLWLLLYSGGKLSHSITDAGGLIYPLNEPDVPDQFPLVIPG